MTDYSDFIIVNYEGGYGGDFFCSILYKCFNKNYTLRYHVDNDDPLNNYIYFPMYMNNVKNFRHLLHCVSTMWDGTFYEKNIPTRFPHMQSAFKIVYDDDYDTAVQNIIEFCRLCYDMSRPKVLSFHYDWNPKYFENFTMDMVFPGSKKLRIVCHEIKHHVLFNMLGAFKTNAVVINASKITPEVAHNITKYGTVWDPAMFTWDFDQYLVKYTQFQDFHDVDIGKFLFGTEDDVVALEKQLTEYLGTEIKFNRSWLTKYKYKNNYILEHMLGHKLDIDDVDNNLIDFKKHFMRTNKYYVE